MQLRTMEKTEEEEEENDNEKGKEMKMRIRGKQKRPRQRRAENGSGRAEARTQGGLPRELLAGGQLGMVMAARPQAQPPWASPKIHSQVR